MSGSILALPVALLFLAFYHFSAHLVTRSCLFTCKSRVLSLFLCFLFFLPSPFPRVTEDRDQDFWMRQTGERTRQKTVDREARKQPAAFPALHEGPRFLRPIIIFYFLQPMFLGLDVILVAGGEVNPETKVLGGTVSLQGLPCLTLSVCSWACAQSVRTLPILCACVLGFCGWRCNSLEPRCQGVPPLFCLFCTRVLVLLHSSLWTTCSSFFFSSISISFPFYGYPS